MPLDATAVMWNTGVTWTHLYIQQRFSTLRIQDCLTQPIKQCKTSRRTSVSKSGSVCVGVCRLATSTTPVFHSRLLVRPRRQWISLRRCSCTPAIRSMTALHSNGGIKERQPQTSTPLAIFHFLIPSLQPSDRVPLTAAALQRQMICAATWFRPLLPSAPF